MLYFCQNVLVYNNVNLCKNKHFENKKCISLFSSEKIKEELYKIHIKSHTKSLVYRGARLSPKGYLLEFSVYRTLFH